MCIYSNIPIAMLLDSLFVQQKNCLWLWLQYCLQFKKNYNQTVTWLKFEQNILNECVLPYIWNTQTFMNLYWIVNVVKLNLKDKFKQSWHTSIRNSPKTLLYRCFKETLEFEKKIVRNSGSHILIRLFKFRTTNKNKIRLSVADGKT